MAIKTASATLIENRAITVGLWHQSGAFDLFYDNNYVGEVVKNMTSGYYSIRIGANAGGENRFIGKISDVIIDDPYTGVESRNMHFGN